MSNKEYSGMSILYMIGICLTVVGAVILAIGIILVANKISDSSIGNLIIVGLSSLFFGMLMIGVKGIAAKIMRDESFTKQQFTTRLCISGGVSLICITFVIKSIFYQQDLNVGLICLAGFIGLVASVDFGSLLLVRLYLKQPPFIGDCDNDVA